MLFRSSRIRDEDAEYFPPMAFPMDEANEDSQSNVFDLGWARRKANSRYANV